MFQKLIKISRTSERKKDAPAQTAILELSFEELSQVAGARITNVRANANGLGGGGLTGTTQLLA